MLRPLVLLLLFSSTLQAEEAAKPRALFIAIDAVPHHIMAELEQEEINQFYRGLEGPTPLISTFPSTTSLALAAILEPLGIVQSPGYEAKHYNWERNRVSGGGLFSYEPFPWRESFDWKIHGLLRKGLSALRPIKAARKDIRQALQAFLESDAPAFFIYFDTTDSAGHLKSPEGLKPILRELDHRLSEMREDNPDTPFFTVLFSDHGLDGGAPLTNVRKGVKRSLQTRGFHVGSKLRRDTDVVFVPFGLVSSFVAYVSPGTEIEVAKVITSTEGVELCAHPEAEGWRVEASRGSAAIERSTEAPFRWRYSWSGEDPLDLGEELHNSFANRRWVEDDEVFRGTHDRRLPDPLHRIVRSFDLVGNPASLVCSVAPGFMYGSKLTVIGSRMSVGRLEWTHGALDRSASLGFLMTDVPGWQPEAALRFDEALKPFADLAE